jgi:hypothetical protein
VSFIHCKTKYNSLQIKNNKEIQFLLEIIGMMKQRKASQRRCSPRAKINRLLAGDEDG